jgi:site-specific DNA-cytosine methylase
MIKTGVSLFAGIGGFDLAMQRAGIEVVATVEWDKHAQSVLTRRFPDTKLYGDITGVTGEQLINAGFDPANGIITGGFPCQDLSVAGRRAGLTGSRSGLFWEICRLLDETKAQNFILENVPGLLSSNEGRDMGTVIRALEERGYSVAWRVLDAQHFGVAQRRRRVFIIGHLGNDWRSLAEILAIGESSSRYSEQSNKKRKETSRIPGDGIADDNRAGNFELYDFPKEAISPTLNARRAHDTMTYQEVARMQGFGDYQMDEIAGSLKARDHKDATDLVIQPFVKIVRSGARAEDGSLPAEVWAERETAPTLNVMDNNGESHATVLINDPTFFYAKNHQGVRIQGDVINTLAATMGTGGGNTPMVHAIQNTVIGRKDTSGPQGKGYGNEEDPMFTLDTTSPHAIAFHMTQTPVSGEISPTIGSSSNGMGMINRSVVRRLTPVECERLQGFPDNWTEGQADSHRYKQLGNAVAVPVVEWIIDRFIQATN